MNDPIFQAFLARQLVEGRGLAESSDLLELAPVHGIPPTHYIAQFHSKGLARRAGDIAEQSHWTIGIFFPDDYLRRAVDVAHVLTYLGPAAEPWHPNVRAPAVCMHIAPGAPLVEILLGLHDLITWNTFSAGDALNPDAAQWYRRQDPARFPVDRRPLKRRSVTLDVRPPASPTHA